MDWNLLAGSLIFIWLIVSQEAFPFISTRILSTMEIRYVQDKKPEDLDFQA
ncbi:MAG: hypothetical protein QS721_05545 [Candidatus Endonucleobacter sp. (ex Gigantidas childressi)]|nr:hypothetical protein [Candidatus Endonucleobacter sp. (ex Gigantidas childressi)]